MFLFKENYVFDSRPGIADPDLTGGGGWGAKTRKIFHLAGIT